jgi:hypothetical protein
MTKLANDNLGYLRFVHVCMRTWIPILALLIFAGGLYMPFRSLSLDDFDAYSFAMALERFDLALQQPQPPGFPLYIFWGRVLLVLVRDPVMALTTLSALSGIGVVLLIYHIGHTLAPHEPFVGIGAAILFALMPMSWLTADKALSDMPGLMWTLLALWFLWQGRRGTNARYAYLALGGLIAGLSLGLRPQNALPLLLLVAWIVISAWLEHQAIKPLLLMVSGLLLGSLIWLLPTLKTVGGLSPYLSLLKAHASHVGQADALTGMGMPLKEALRARAMTFGDTFLTYTIGVELFGPWEIADTLHIVALALALGPAVLAAIVCRYAYADWRREEICSLVIWALAMIAQVFLFETLDRPRLMLPILPPLALLIAWGWASVGDAVLLMAQKVSLLRSPKVSPLRSPKVSRPRRKVQQKRLLRHGILWVQALALCATALALLIQGAPLAAQLSLIPAPPAQACDYVAAHYAPHETLVATAGSFRAVQVELPAYHPFYLYRFDAEAIQATLDSDRIRYVVIFDRDQFPASAMNVLGDQGRFVPLEERTFSRDRRVHTQHDKVRVQVLTPASLIPLTALTLPPDGCLDIGGEADGRYLGEGWFRPEVIGGVQGRWAGGTLTSTVRLNLPAARGYRLRFRALAYPAEQTVRVCIGKTCSAYRDLPQAWTEFEIALPQFPGGSDQVATLRFVHGHARAPLEVTGGGSSDTRRLTAAYDWLCLVPE